MKLKHILIWCGKAIGGGLAAVVVLTCFCGFYYNVPLPCPNPNGTTDVLWTPNTFYIQAREGLGWGKSNDEGFLESVNYRDDRPVDILIMGGSYVEGSYVPQHETMTTVLSDLMPEKMVYHVGMINHIFLTCCNNLEAALNHYKPVEAVIMEVDRVDFSVEELCRVAEGTISEINRGSSNRVYNLLASNPFLRLTHKQLTEFLAVAKEKNVGASEAVNPALTESVVYLDALDAMLGKLGNLCKQHDTNLILFYHPETRLGSDGALLFDTDPAALHAFREDCERHGITFVDMSDSFAQLYEEEYKLPYGFINSQVGKGHFNADGHRLVAQKLCTAIRSLEGEGE